MTHDNFLEPSIQQLMLDLVSQALTLPHLLQTSRLRLFYGDLHNHTGYSDGSGRPEDALRQMRARGLHFAAITDHGEFLDDETANGNTQKWAATAQQAAWLTSEDFVAMRGFEWSSPRQGHSNVWCSATYTGYRTTGDESIRPYYEWLREAQPMADTRVLAGFNHPGREAACFDGWTFEPTLTDRIVTLECFNREEEYGNQYFRALDHGWHVGAIGVSDHHGDDWGNATFPRAGVLAPTLRLSSLQAALLARQVFATRSPTLALLILGNTALMGARLQLSPHTPLDLGVWCNDPEASHEYTRLELWSNGGTLVAAYETRGLQQVSWRVTMRPQGSGEHWFVVRVLHGGVVLAYSSPIWVRWS